MARKPKSPAPSVPDVLSVLKVLADASRLRLFLALRDKERCVRDLADSEELPQPLVSHHLAVLVRAGLIRSRRSESYTFYVVDADGMGAAQRALTELLDPQTIGPLARAGGNADCCR